MDAPFPTETFPLIDLPPENNSMFIQFTFHLTSRQVNQNPRAPPPPAPELPWTSRAFPHPASSKNTARIQVNVFLSFVLPMLVISVLNSIIANQLIVMVKQSHQETQVCTIGGQQTVLSMSMEPSRIQSMKHGVRVLRVVVIAFVVCWLPYHVRRLMFCYVPEELWTEGLNDFYHYFYMFTNILFYVSSTVNPILYNLVSANFRQVFVSTLRFLCPPWRRKKQHQAFTRKSNSISSTNHTCSTQITRETPY